MPTIKMLKLNTVAKSVIMTAFLFLFTPHVNAQNAEYDFSGSWKTEQGPLIQITKNGDTFKGVNTEHDKLVLENLRFEDDKWTGTLIRPKDGSKYDCTVEVAGSKMTLTVKKGMFSKSFVWTKQ